MLLKDKVAVIYGAGGGIGGAVARAFDEAGRVDISFNAVGAPDSTIVGRAAGRSGCRALLAADRDLIHVEEMANMAAFLASDKASGMTGTIVNLTMGSLDD